MSVSRWMQVGRVDAISVGKLFGALYGTLGGLFGLLYSLAVAAVSVFAAVQGEPEAMLGLLAAVALVIGLPLVYGMMGAVMGVITAGIYNFAAGRVGGIRFELVEG